MDNQSKKELIDIANYIHSKGISVPCIFFLESTKYIAFIGNQFMHVLGPMIRAFFNERKYYKYTDLLESRENIEFLIKEIEKLNYKESIV